MLHELPSWTNTFFCACVHCQLAPWLASASPLNGSRCLTSGICDAGVHLLHTSPKLTHAHVCAYVQGPLAPWKTSAFPPWAKLSPTRAQTLQARPMVYPSRLSLPDPQRFAPVCPSSSHPIVKLGHVIKLPVASNLQQFAQHDPSEVCSRLFLISAPCCAIDSCRA